MNTTSVDDVRAQRATRYHIHWHGDPYQRQCTIYHTLLNVGLQNATNSSATAEITRDANDVNFSVEEPRNGHWRSLEVIRCCANRCGIYDFLLALNSNLTSSFNRSWDITPSLHIHTLPLFQVEVKKDGWEYVDVLWCQVPRTLQYLTVNLNPR